MSEDSDEKSFVCHDLDSAKAAARNLASRLHLNDIVCFSGTLGAGKTTLIKSIVHYLDSEINESDITSPTFNYLHIYREYPPIFHFDLYRLANVEDFLKLGFEEYLQSGLALIEWPDRILQLLPAKRVEIEITITGFNSRKISFKRTCAKTFV